ncbi:MAG: efflux RND transporter periplasmic adaptor subunit [Bauldia sp.]|nr:efflux RND transporter periplasmic adaptor subunit [Bauldia sp.]
MALFLCACSASPATSPPEAESANSTAAAALTVTVASVATGSAETIVAATGTISAWQEVIVSAETSGLAIVDIAVAEGDTVKKGQMLARLNDSQLRAQIAEQEAAIREAKASAEKAAAANRRAETLLAKNTVSQETAEAARTDLATSEARLAQAQAALDTLKVQLSRAEIRAPVDGYVSEPPSVLGTVIQSGTALFHIVRDGRLEVAALVPEQYLSEIVAGQQVEVTNAAGVSVNGTVRGIASKVASATRLGTVYIALPPGTSLRPGMFARIAISVESRTALFVPSTALVWRAGKPNVFVLGEGDVVSARPVALGPRSDGRVAVTSGLAAGEHVVVSGAGFLDDGNVVRVASADTSTAASRKAE